MRAVPSDKGTLRYISAAVSFFVVVAFLAGAGAGFAKELKTYHGVITAVGRKGITVGHRTFDIGTAKILDPSGSPVAAADLVPGLQVDIFIRKGKVESVLVYESGLR